MKFGMIIHACALYLKKTWLRIWQELYGIVIFIKKDRELYYNFLIKFFNIGHMYMPECQLYRSFMCIILHTHTYNLLTYMNKI